MTALILILTSVCMLCTVLAGSCSAGACSAGGPIPSLFGDDDERCARRHVPDYGEGVSEEDVEAVRAMLSGGKA